VTGGDPAPAGPLTDSAATRGGADADRAAGVRGSRVHELGGGPAAGRLGSRAAADLASGAVLGTLDGRLPGRVADGVAAAGPAASQAAGGDLLDGEPIVSTYHSYAARLVADHALREALEPTVRLITPAVAWQMAARVVAAYAGPMDAVHWSPQTVSAAVLDLAGELAEHLSGPGDLYQIGDWLEAAARALPGRMPSVVRKTLDCQRTREQLLPLVAGYVAAQAARGGVGLGDPGAAGPPDRNRQRRGGRDRTRQVPGGAPGRVPRHQPRPAGAAAGVVRRGSPGDRRGRPVPVHLRLARGQRGQPRPVRPRVPRRRPPGHGR